MLGRLMWLQGRRTGGFVVVVVVEEGLVHLLLLLILGRTRRTGRFVVVIIGEEEEGVPSQCTLGSALSKSNFELFSQYGLYFYHAKNQPPPRPRSTFSEH